MSVAASVLDAVRAESELHGGARVTRAGLRIEFAPWTRRCRVCAADFRMTDARPECGACGSGDTETAGGDQMELSLLELEET